MDYRELVNKIFEKGKEKMNDLEVFIESSKEIEIGVFKGEIDKYSVSQSGGLSLRGLSNGKMGYSYTEKIDESSIDMLIDEAYENGTYIDALDLEEIFKGSDSYEEINCYNENLSNTPMENKIELVKKLEEEALSLDKRVVSVQMCGYSEVDNIRYIMNTKGVDLSHRLNGGVIYISVVVKDGEDTKTGLGYRNFTDLSQVDYKEIAKEAVEQGISMLGATSMKSDNYEGIIKNKVFGDILQAFSGIFSGDNVQKGLSMLKDKIGEDVANELFTLTDNPFLEGGFGSKAFDDEGTRTSIKKVIDKGRLTTYLHNWKSAKKDNVESTGNGSRSSYKSSLSISPSNFYVEKGESSLQELIESTNKGVLIVDVAGLHSGLNPVSGDFSLSANGYEIENGKIIRPVNQITIAGNFFELLKNIEAIGNDLEFGFPSSGYFGSPSIKIKSISVSGE